MSTTPENQRQEMEKLMTEVERDANWSLKNYLNGSVAHGLAKKEVAFISWVRSLQSAHDTQVTLLKDVISIMPCVDFCISHGMAFKPRPECANCDRAKAMHDEKKFLWERIRAHFKSDRSVPPKA